MISPFLAFARRLLSISANSASCERLFSIFGNILTKLRNRTGNTTLLDLATVKMNLCNEHIQLGTKSRLKRNFGANFQQDQTTESPATPNIDEIISGKSLHLYSAKISSHC